jgi:hypothetical protein
VRNRHTDWHWRPRNGSKRGNALPRVPARTFKEVARPERVELPTFWFVARRSIQLSYGRVFVCNNLRGVAEALVASVAKASQKSGDVRRTDCSRSRLLPPVNLSARNAI